MDLNKLRTLVFEKTGIKIETNDPIFALVALNEAVLSECVEQHISGLQKAALQLEEQTAQLIAAGDRAKKLLLQMGQAVEDPAALPMAKIPAARTPDKESRLPWRWIGAVGGASVFSALLVLAGQAVFGYSRAAAPPLATVPTAAPALTPEQTRLIQEGEKYAKLWPKLDAKTQAQIQALSR